MRVGVARGGCLSESEFSVKTFPGFCRYYKIRDISRGDLACCLKVRQAIDCNSYPPGETVGSG
jgi:hypothetical protein